MEVRLNSKPPHASKLLTERGGSASATGSDRAPEPSGLQSAICGLSSTGLCDETIYAHMKPPNRNLYDRVPFPLDATGCIDDLRNRGSAESYAEHEAAVLFSASPLAQRRATGAALFFVWPQVNLLEERQC